MDAFLLLTYIFSLIPLIPLIVSNNQFVENDDYYPKYVKKVFVRKVLVEGGNSIPVTRGRFELLGSFEGYKHIKKQYAGVLSASDDKRVSVSEFKKILQCANREPSLDGNRGSLSLLKLLPPTKATFENFCAQFESGCSPLRKCQTLVQKFKKGGYRRDSHLASNPGRNLLRILNNELFLDWAWGMDLKTSDPYPSMTTILFNVLDKAKGFKNVSFIMGSEQPFLGL